MVHLVIIEAIIAKFSNQIFPQQASARCSKRLGVMILLNVRTLWLLARLKIVASHLAGFMSQSAII